MFARKTLTQVFLMLLLPAIWPCAAFAQTVAHIGFEHVVIIIQENRTPDNLFQGLCNAATSCSAHPTHFQYNIETSNWTNKASPTGVTRPVPAPLANNYDPRHKHEDFVAMCDKSPATGKCRMDGAAGIYCKGLCPANAEFSYVDNSTGILNPYLTLATQYGWDNYMFQTNQGPSLPAHQFLFGATSASNAKADHAGTFMSENVHGPLQRRGCTSVARVSIQLIDENGVEDPDNRAFPCAEHKTVADMLTAHGFTWRYYAPSADGLWTAPNMIDHICMPKNGSCTGPEWLANVDLNSNDALRDIANCKLRSASWIVPTGQNSDHPLGNKGGGPSWVASIVNAIGMSKCKDGLRSYWQNTAIFIVWDDWGGWYDHEPPRLLAAPEGGYQYGFRVPLIVVSAYTPKGKIGHARHDFGSIVRFVEHNFLIHEGALTFADSRSRTDLQAYFHLMKPRPFQPIPTTHDANFFLNDKSLPLPPDDD